jgi:hypothetical protein
VPNFSACRLFSLVLEWGINHVIPFSTPTPAGPATSNALRATPPSSTPTPRPSATPIVIDRATRPSLHRPSPHSVRRSPAGIPNARGIAVSHPPRPLPAAFTRRPPTAATRRSLTSLEPHIRRPCIYHVDYGYFYAPVAGAAPASRVSAADFGEDKHREGECDGSSYACEG